MPLYRRGRGDLEIQRFLETTQVILAQIATFLQQCDTQSTILEAVDKTRIGLPIELRIGSDSGSDRVPDQIGLAIGSDPGSNRIGSDGTGIFDFSAELLF